MRVCSLQALRAKAIAEGKVLGPHSQGGGKSQEASTVENEDCDNPEGEEGVGRATGLPACVCVLQTEAATPVLIMSCVLC